jgi:hypothetical protein
VIATLLMVALVPAIALPSSGVDAASLRPVIVWRSITPNATGVSTFSQVAVRFDRPVDGVDDGALVIRDARGKVVPTTVRYDPVTFRARLIPTGPLKVAAKYTVVVNGHVQSVAGGAALAESTWAFRTGSQPEGGTRFDSPKEVRVEGGKVTGVRFDGYGRITARKSATLSQPTTMLASHRAVVRDRAYFYIVSGRWAGFYIARDVARVTGVEAPPVEETPPPSPLATPDPDEPVGSGASATPTPSVSTPPTPAPTPVVTPAPATPAPTPVSGPTTVGTGIVVSAAEIGRLPTSGPAWDSLKRAADAAAGSPDLSVNSQDNNVLVLAKALVYARTGVTKYRTEVLAALRGAMGTEAGGDTLALGRELAAYVIAADVIGLRSADPALDSVFRSWLRTVLDRKLIDGVSLTETHERRPNNWGTHAGASRAAAAAYLGDSAELARVAAVFRGWTGDRAAYAGFRFGDLWWQSSPSQPVGINPVGATIQGRNVDGVLPEEQRRTGEFTWPPPCGNYPHGALDGALLTAEILTRAGYPAYEWSNRALLRAVNWLRGTGCAATGDNVWQLPLLDARYGTAYWNGAPVRPGKNFGWTDWLFGR